MLTLAQHAEHGIYYSLNARNFGIASLLMLAFTSLTASEVDLFHNTIPQNEGFFNLNTDGFAASI